MGQPVTMDPRITLTAVAGFPLVRPGDDLLPLILDAVNAHGITLCPGDILALASKVISKSEGRLVRLEDVVPSARAYELAAKSEKDPRLVQVILDESKALLRLRPGLLIMRHRLGFVCANAGVDQSNVGPRAVEEGLVALLPLDPDASAAELRRRIREVTGVEVAVVIVDSHGRPHRMGAVGVAIGAAGLPALEDWRGRPDLFGRPLAHTQVGLADQVAGAASLLLGQAAEGIPLVLLRGVPFEPCEGCAAQLIRPRDLDLFP
jgi:coenzyme F420-0:L-glutamate ligase/coenzyme F420-1:gamma-L-glutamate ligase